MSNPDEYDGRISACSLTHIHTLNYLLYLPYYPVPPSFVDFPFPPLRSNLGEYDWHKVACSLIHIHIVEYPQLPYLMTYTIMCWKKDP